MRSEWAPGYGYGDEADGRAAGLGVVGVDDPAGLRDGVRAVPDHVFFRASDNPWEVEE